MYERFSDRARKVMQLANQEAQRFNHEYIGTEHILLGLVKEGSGVAANVLENLDIDLRKIREETEKLVKPGGPEGVTVNRIPHSPGAKKAIENAVAAASDLNHNYVGTEHLLLGLLRVEEGTAVKVLTALGVTVEKVREEVLLLVGPKLEPEMTAKVWSVELPVDTAAVKAWQEARRPQLRTQIVRRIAEGIYAHLATHGRSLLESKPEALEKAARYALDAAAVFVRIAEQPKGDTPCSTNDPA